MPARIAFSYPFVIPCLVPAEQSVPSGLQNSYGSRAYLWEGVACNDRFLECCADACPVEPGWILPVFQKGKRKVTQNPY